MFDFIPFHLTFQGDVSAPNKNKAILVFVTKKDFEINGHEIMQVFVTKPTVKWLIGNVFSEGGILEK